MEPSPAPYERPAKAEANEPVKPGSLSRFRRLANHLCGVDRGDFKEALEKDEAEHVVGDAVSGAMDVEAEEGAALAY